MHRSIILGGIAAIALGGVAAGVLYSLPQPELPQGGSLRPRPAGREIVLAIEGMH